MIHGVAEGAFCCRPSRANERGPRIASLLVRFLLHRDGLPPHLPALMELSSIARFRARFRRPRPPPPFRLRAGVVASNSRSVRVYDVRQGKVLERGRERALDICRSRGVGMGLEAMSQARFPPPPSLRGAASRAFSRPAISVRRGYPFLIGRPREQAPGWKFIGHPAAWSRRRRPTAASHNQAHRQNGAMELPRDHFFLILLSLPFCRWVRRKHQTKG